MALFRTGRNLFHTHEIVVLDAVRERLPAAAGRLLEDQVTAVRKVQRLQGGREVNLYAGRSAPRWPEECLFPNRTTELRLATVRLIADAYVGEAVMHTVCGHVFQIQFRPSPSEIGNSGSFGTTTVTLHTDPLEPVDGNSTADLVERIPSPLRAELEGLWASGSISPLLSRGEVFEFQLDDGTYVMLAQLPDTTFVAIPLDTADHVVRRFEPGGRVVGGYRSIAPALELWWRAPTSSARLIRNRHTR